MRPWQSRLLIICLAGILVNMVLWWRDIARPYQAPPAPPTYPFATLVAMVHADVPGVAQSILLPTLGATVISAESIAEFGERITLSPPSVIYYADPMSIAFANAHSGDLRSLARGGDQVYITMLVDGKPQYVTELVYRAQKWSIGGGFAVDKSFMRRVMQLQQARLEQGLEERVDLLFWAEPKSQLGSSIFALVEEQGQTRVIPLFVEGPFFRQLATADRGYLAAEIFPLMQAHAQAILKERAENPMFLGARLLCSLPWIAAVVSCICVGQALLRRRRG